MQAAFADRQMGKMVAFRRVLLVALILPVLLLVMNGLAYNEFKLNRSDLWVIVIAVVVASHTQISLALQGRSTALQECIGRSEDGWYHLTPSPLELYRVAIGILSTVLFADLYVCIEPPRPMAKWLSIISILITGYLLHHSFVRRTRWSDDRIEQRYGFLWPRAIRLRDIARIRKTTWADDVRIDGMDGTRIRIPVNQIGSLLLMGMIPSESEKPIDTQTTAS
jgi:hypothetical protein